MARKTAKDWNKMAEFIGDAFVAQAHRLEMSHNLVALLIGAPHSTAKGLLESKSKLVRFDQVVTAMWLLDTLAKMTVEDVASLETDTRISRKKVESLLEALEAPEPEADDPPLEEGMAAEPEEDEYSYDGTPL